MADWQQLNLIGFITGIGIFLFGMLQLEKAIARLSGNGFQQFLRDQTRNPLIAITAGTLITAIMQSSSMVSLVVLAFSGAGVIPLYNGIGIIMGANLGTTFTGWVVTTLGFKIELSAFALPIVGGGSLLMVLLSERKRFAAWGRLFVGLGMLLFGLSEMKGSVEQLATSLDLSALAGFHPLIYLGAGVIFTAVIQSSSATMMITLSALHVGILQLEAAAALIIGADLGTTSTMILGGFKGSAVKKQLAAAQILFNFCSALLAFLLLQPLLGIVTSLISAEQTLYRLVAFHSLFNLLGIVLFVPFLKPFAKLMERLFATEVPSLPRFISNVPANLSSAALIALNKEAARLADRIYLFNLRNLKIDPEHLRCPQERLEQLLGTQPGNLPFEQRYNQIKRREGDMLRYAMQMQQAGLSESEAERLQRLLLAVRLSVYGAKCHVDCRKDIARFRHSDDPLITDYFPRLRTYEREFYTTILTLAELGKKTLVEQIAVLRQQEQDHRHRFEQSILTEADAAETDRVELSSLLNLNRQLKEANLSLLESVENLSATGADET